MNRKSLLLSAAAVVLLGYSCEKPEEQLQPGADKVSVNAILSDGRSWKDGDQITVNNRKYTIAEGVGTTSAVFNGVTKADTYAAAYDFGMGTVENNVLSLSIAGKQGGEYVSVRPMAASSSTTDLTFIPLTGTLQIPITGSATVTKIEISATGSDKLSGKATVALSFKDKPEVQFAQTASPALTLEPGATPLPATFSVEMVAASYQDLQLMIYDNEGKVMSHTIPATAIKGGAETKADEFEFKTEGPQPVMLSISSENDAFGKPAVWSDDALVNVNGTAALIKEGAGTGTGKFGPVVNSESGYHVLAPAAASNGFGSGIFRLNLPTKIEFGQDPSEYSVRVGKADGQNNAELKYLTGIVKVTVSGNRSLRSAKLQSNDKNIDIAGEAAVDMASEEPVMILKGNTSESITMESLSGYNISGGKELYFAVPAGTYSEGFTLVLTDDRNLVKTHRTEGITVTRNQVEDLGSIEWVGTEADNSDLSALGYANCYMVATKGTYNFETRLHDGTKVSNITKADWLWATSEGLISDIKYSDGRISFTASEKEGNVLIAAFDSKNEIVWSWHIWLTDIPEIINYHNFDKAGDGFYFQDRNLGAVSGEINGDPKETYGLLYQFGRKDPFYGGIGNEKQIIPPTEEGGSETIIVKPFENAKTQTVCNTKYSQAEWKSAEGTAEQGTIDFATKNPMFFLAGNVTTGKLSWLATGEYDPYQGPEDGLWKPFEKTNYDPCPPGYQVPRKGAWNGIIMGNNAEWLGKGTDRQGMVFTNEEGKQTWYPAQGRREAHPDEMGALIYEGRGYYSGYGQVAMWVSEILTGTDYHSLSVAAGTVSSSEETSGCAQGYAVRCVKEYKYKDIVIPSPSAR